MFEKLISEALDFKGGKEFFQKLQDILESNENAEGIVILLKTSKNCMKLDSFIDSHPDITKNYLWQKAISISGIKWKDNET